MWCHSPTAMLRVNGAIQKSTDVMKAMQSLCKIPQIQETMRELSKEMMKVKKHCYLFIKPLPPDACGVGWGGDRNAVGEG